MAFCLRITNRGGCSGSTSAPPSTGLGLRIVRSSHCSGQFSVRNFLSGECNLILTRRQFHEQLILAGLLLIRSLIGVRREANPSMVQARRDP